MRGEISEVCRRKLAKGRWLGQEKRQLDWVTRPYIFTFLFIVKGYFYYRKYRSHSAHFERYFLPQLLILLEDISVPYSLLEESVGTDVYLCSSEDFLDYCCFGIGVVLRVFPVVASKFPFGVFVEATIGFVATQPVAEEKHAVNLATA